VRKDYYAFAVNGRAVVGLKTNRDRYDPTDPEYVARPVLWPSPRSTPIKLAMPDGYYGDAFLDIMGDGTINGIVRDRVERNNYLAMWATPGSDPVLQRPPDLLMPIALSGRWVVGRAGFLTCEVFVRSLDRGVRHRRTAVAGTQSPSAATGRSSSARRTKPRRGLIYLGSTAGTVHELGTDVEIRDVAGSLGGQVLLRRDNISVEVVTCALALHEASDFTVTSLPLP